MANYVKIILIVAAIGVLAVIFFAGGFYGTKEEAVLLGEEQAAEEEAGAVSVLPAEATSSTAEEAPVLPQNPVPAQEKSTSSSSQIPKPVVKPEDQQAEREPQEFIVRIYDYDRAEPANLTIRVGDTVTFINEDNDLRWPGADPHPTHSGLPLFDALGGISQNQSYSHTFKTIGKYPWHDHIFDNPPTIGTITVIP